jgi:GMP synthase-like glutamine amidotransferase
MQQKQKNFRVAILDLNDGHPNQGMRCIREILHRYANNNGISIFTHEYNVRQLAEIPDTADFDIYISSGGPGSPLADEDKNWGGKYFRLIDNLYQHNLQHEEKKFVFFICHSYQLACRHFQVAEICERKSTSFGVFPVHKWEDGLEEPVFKGLPDPFYSVDSRDWQVINPDKKNMEEAGAKILAIEKERPHVPLERAIMAIRFSDEMIGTQFHPEADAIGMSHHLQTAEKRKQVIENVGEEKYHNMIAQLNDPDKIMLTQQIILPSFLDMAVQSLQEVMC